MMIDQVQIGGKIFAFNVSPVKSTLTLRADFDGTIAEIASTRRAGLKSGVIYRERRAQRLQVGSRVQCSASVLACNAGNSISSTSSRTTSPSAVTSITARSV